MRPGPYRPPRPETPSARRRPCNPRNSRATPKRAHGVAVPVGEQREIQVERLHPGDVRPGRVARDPDRLHARLLELRAPVTQELQLVCSGRRTSRRDRRGGGAAFGHEVAQRDPSAAPSRPARQGTAVPLRASRRAYGTDRASTAFAFRRAVAVEICPAGNSTTKAGEPWELTALPAGYGSARRRSWR